MTEENATTLPDVAQDDQGNVVITPPTNAVADTAALADALRNKIMGINDALTEIVIIPEWDNVEIEFHSLTGAEKSEWMAKLESTRNAKSKAEMTWQETQKVLQMFVNLAVYTAYFPGSDIKIFQPGDASWLLAKSSKALGRLEDTVGKLNGFVLDETKGTAIDEAKNS